MTNIAKVTEKNTDQELSYVLVRELGLPVFVDILKLVEKGIFINAISNDKNTYTEKLVEVLHTLKSLLQFYHLQDAQNICLQIQKEVPETFSRTVVTSEKRKNIEKYFLKLKQEIYSFMENALIASERKPNF